MGQVYVLVSRCTDPQNFLLVGLPPKDLLEDLAATLIKRGIDVDKYFEDACSVTREWVYDKEKPLLKDRIQVKFNNKHTTPVKHRKLEEVLNPQPDATVVIHRLLDYMDRVDRPQISRKNLGMRFHAVSRLVVTGEARRRTLLF